MSQDQTPFSGKQSPEQTDTETSYPDLTFDEIKAIAPINRSGSPDLYNHMPTRMVPLEEAKYRKWGYFFVSNPCRYGHVCGRYTSNPRKCIDCTRLAAGKGTIGEKAGVDIPGMKRKVSGGASGIIVNVQKPVQIDAWEKRFLEAYAHHKDFKAACEALPIEEAKVESRLAYSDSFKKAYDNLEERMGMKKVNSSEGFIWTKEKHDKIIEVYINTGDMATARDSIGVTPFEYFQELARNHTFAARIKEADPLAHLALEERAIQLALAGNDKLLQKVLSVKKPEYRENLKVEMNVTEKLDDRQLQSRLLRLVNKLRPVSVIEGEVADASSSRAATTSRTIGRDGPTEKPSEDRPVLQYTGS